MQKSAAIFSCLIVVSLSMSLISCSPSSSFVSLNSLKSSLNLKAFPGRREYPDADAVILSDVHNVRVEVNREGKVETNVYVTKVIKLLRNVNEHASIEIPVYSGNSLNGLSARTIEPDGSTIVLRKGDFHTITGSGNDYIFYSDEKKVRFTFPAVTKNCVIEYHYIMHESHPFIEDIWEIQQMYPVLDNVYSLTLPARLLVPPQNGGYGWNWRYKVYNCSMGAPAYHVNPDENPDYETVTLTWTKKDIPAFKPDPRMPPYLDLIQYVKFAPSRWKTWDDISEWYYGFLFKPQMDITPEISEKADELTQGCQTDSEEIERVFDFIQTLRYVAIELGEGGYIPSKPATVLERMYGDCKDKSILLVSLLRSLGIAAKPVLVLTSDEGKVDPSFPSWMFNHMIVKVTIHGGRDYWLDPTVGHCALGEIPYPDEGTNALVLNYDNTSEVERIPSSTFTQNVENISAGVILDKRGDADYDVGMRFIGQDNFITRSTIAGLSHDEMLRYCKSLLAGSYMNATVEDYSFKNTADFDKPFILQFNMEVADVLQKQGGVVLLDVDPFRFTGDWKWLDRDHRAYNLRFDYPRTATKTLNIMLPPGYSVKTLPAPTVIKCPGLYYSRIFTIGVNGHLGISETFAVTRRDISAKDYKSVKEFAEKVDRIRNELVMLGIEHPNPAEGK